MTFRGFPGPWGRPARTCWEAQHFGVAGGAAECRVLSTPHLGQGGSQTSEGQKVYFGERIKEGFFEEVALS